jgi:hypothetical protein
VSGRQGVSIYLQLAQECQRLREQVECVDEDDGHSAAAADGAEAVQQVQDDDVTRDQRARKGGALEAVRRPPQRLQRLRLCGARDSITGFPFRPSREFHSVTGIPFRLFHGKQHQHEQNKEEATTRPATGLSVRQQPSLEPI